MRLISYLLIWRRSGRGSTRAGRFRLPAGITLVTPLARLERIKTGREISSMSLSAGEMDGNPEILSPLKDKFGDFDIIKIRSMPLDRRHNSKVDYGRLRKLLEQHLQK